MVGPVVDAHVHIFSPDANSARSVLVEREPWFGHLYTDPKAHLAGVADLDAAMTEAGVEVAVACGFPWRDVGRCRAENDYLAATSLRSGGRIVWLASVPPANQDAAVAEAVRALSLGASGIGELNADGQGFDLRDAAALAPLVAVCLAADKPVLLHASEPVGHDYRGKGTATPDKLLALIVAFPDLRLVLAHWGGGLPFYELMPEVAAACANVRYDTAASTYLYRPQVFRAVLDVVGPARVLWGSDFPVLRMGRFLRQTRRNAGLTEAEVAPVFGGNAVTTYGLRVGAPAVAP